ncbi:MAG: ABC transporter permease subunit [Dehalococcoidia bacterium]|nr:ABC transporter permease subunit [Dehalococcoidia bacterium]
MIRLINAEFFKLRKRLMTRVLLFVLMGVTAVACLVLLAISRRVITGPGLGMMQGGAGTINPLGLPLALPIALSIISTLGAVLAVILSANSIGSEYSWRTIRTMLICSEGRLKLLGAKLIAVAALVLIGMVIGLATGFAMSLVTTAIGGYAFDFSFATSQFLWEQFLQFWRVFYVLVPYILLGFLFAVVGRSVMPGSALGIGVLFLEPIATAFMGTAGGWIARIPDYLLAANVRVITSMGSPPQFITAQPEAVISSQTTGTAHAFITLALYNIVFIAAAFYLFRKRDVTG